MRQTLSPVFFAALAVAVSQPVVAQKPLGNPAGKALTFADVLKGSVRYWPGRVPRWAAQGHRLEVRRGRLLDVETGKEGPGRAAPFRRGGRSDAARKARIAARDLVKQLGLKGVQVLRAAPDGATILYKQEHNLWFLRPKAGGGATVRRLTKAGGPERLMGRLDWVYQEEVYGRGRWDAFWWSPDGAWLAWLDLDTAKVPRTPLVDDAPFRQRYRLQRYPKPGDPNAAVRVRLAATAGGGARELDPRKWGGAEALVTRVHWGPGPRLWLQVMDREQRRLVLVRWDPGTGKAREILREERTDGWIRYAPAPVFLKGGREFLWHSDRDGLRHLYRYAADGRLLGRVTRGEWQVKSLLWVDEKAGTLACMGTEGMALERHLYAVDLAGRKPHRRLTTPGRDHTVRFSPDRRYFTDAWSTIDDPGGVEVRSAADGSLVRTLSRHQATPLERWRLGRVQLHKVPGPDGSHLNASTVAPAGWDGRKPLPVWFDVYGGPAAQGVRNRWRLSTWHHFLADQGVLVVRCDPRSASGRGHKYHILCYQHLGREELKDLEACIAWLTAKGWADPTRVGITGVSYGGFLANYALTHSKAFRCGIAVAGLSDWRNYDTIYTERYMRTPAANPAGYRLSSCLDAAAALHGHLLIVHGDLDDNVHVSNTIQLAHALQKAGRQNFSLMIYAREGHGVGRREHRTHYRRMLWEFISKHLKPGS